MSDGEKILSSDEIADVMSHDPFAKLGDGDATPAGPDDTTTPAASVAGGDSEGATPPVGTGDANGQPSDGGSTAAQPETTENPDGTPQTGAAEEGEFTSKQLLEIIADYRAGRVRPDSEKPGGADKPEGESAEPKVPDYAFNIPEKLVGALASEDPAERKSALGALSQGVAQAVHRTVVQEIQETLKGYGLQGKMNIGAMVQSTLLQHQESERIKQDFYGTHKDLDKPQLRQVVQAVAAEYYKNNSKATWGNKMRDDIASNVRKLLGMPDPSKTPAATQTNGAKPPKFTGGSSSRAAETPSKSPNSADAISDVLFG